jgi:DNA-binding winged helix-turn-helix (wHTH) protein
MNAITIENRGRREIAGPPGTSGPAPFIWDHERRVLRRNAQDGRRVSLTKREAEVFETLLRIYPRFASREFLMDAVYGLDSEDEPNNQIIDCYLTFIRSKLKNAGFPLWLEAVAQVGWTLSLKPPERVARSSGGPGKPKWSPLLQANADQLWAILQATPGRIVLNADLRRNLDLAPNPTALAMVAWYLRATGRGICFGRRGRLCGYFVEAA